MSTNLCACKSADEHEREGHIPSGTYSWHSSEALFGGNCAKGWHFGLDKDLHEVFPHLVRMRNIEANPVEAVADFYLLDAIKSGLLGRDVIPTDFTDDYIWRRQRSHPFNETGMKLCGCPLGVGDIVAPCEHDGRISEFSWHLFRGTHRMPDHIMKPIQKAERLQNKMVHKWASIFWSYGALAFASELAYLRSMQDVARRQPFSDSEGTFDQQTILGAFAALERNFGPQSWALHIADAFDPQLASWSGSYGGTAWKNCARQYERMVNDDITPKLFVDRVFTLQHNTSTFLNKATWWKGKMPDEYDGTDVGLYDMKYALNAHAADDYRTLLEYASSKVKRLWERYWDHIQYERVVMRDLPAATPEWAW